MMVDRLREVIATIEKLPAERQEQLANTLEELLEEEEWDELTSQPGAAAFHEALLQEYEQEKATGTLEQSRGIPGIYEVNSIITLS